MIPLGRVKPGSTIFIPWETFASSTGAPITMSGLATTDVQIYKDGGTTQRASDAGVTLLDTDGTDFDGITGLHGISINLADNTTADFYQAGSQYMVAISTVTVDSQTMSFWAASFRIGYETAILDTTIATLASQTSFTLTAGPADDNALVGCPIIVHDAASSVQMAIGTISAYTGSTKTVTLSADPAIFTIAAKDNVSVMPPSSVRAVAGSKTAADNLKLQFDGTGLTGGTYPSTQAQVSAIGTGVGGALNFAPDSDNASTAIKTISKVGTQTGTYANTANDNGTYHVITNAADNIDWVYGYSVGGGRVASKVTFVGYLAASAPATSKSINMLAYNFASPGWDTIKTITGQAGTTDITVDATLLAAHTGTGSDAGKVYIRFTATSQAGAVLNTDQLVVSAQNLGQTTGYADGAVWIGGANTGTTPYVDGTADNPVTYATALTIASAVGLTRFRVRNGTTVTLGADSTNKTFIGSGWTLALGSQAIDGAYFIGCEVSGTGTCTTQPTFDDCHINAGTTVGPSKFLRCGFAGTSGSKVTAGSAGEFLLVDCYSEVAGSGTPYFSFPGACGVNIRRWSGGNNITLNNSSSTLTVEVVTGGGQTVTTGGANVEIRGIPRSVTLAISGSETCQIDAVTGPITISGSATAATVNIYGVYSTVSDSSTGSTVNQYGLSRTSASNVLTIANDAITANAIQDGAITNAKVADDVDVNVKTITANAITSTAINDGAITNAKVADDVDVNVKTITNGAITAAAIATDAVDADALATDAITEIVLAILKTDWTGITGEASRSVLNALRGIRNKTSVAAGTLTVTKEDDATSAWTAAVTTDAAADPIVTVDPA